MVPVLQLLKIAKLLPQARSVIRFLAKVLKRLWKWSLKKLDTSPTARVVYLCYTTTVTSLAVVLWILLRFCPGPTGPVNVAPVTLISPTGTSHSEHDRLIVRGNRVSYGDWNDRIPLGGRLIIAPGKAPYVQKYRFCFVPKAGAVYERGELRPVGGARLVCLDRFGVEALAGENSLYGGIDFELPVLNTVTSSVGYALPYRPTTDPGSILGGAYVGTNFVLRY